MPAPTVLIGSLRYKKNDHHMIAVPYYSGFEQAHDTYNAIGAASDGNIYYVLCSESPYEGGKVCRYDPRLDKTEILADLTEICGEHHARAVPQGKSHVEFYERDGKLWFATHVGFYEIIEGMDRLPENPPGGLGRYPGGHILSYELSSGKFTDHAIAPHGEGILTMVLDAVRGFIYALTWPSGYFLSYCIETGKLTEHGTVSERGEAGIPGSDYRVLCRSLLVDPRDGVVYLSTSEGDVIAYRPGAPQPEKLAGVDLRLDYFGKYDPCSPGSMGYNWRKILWYEPEEVAYGVHGNSGYLFRFDPRRPGVELVERITSLPSKKSGMFDQFSYGYLGFQLAPRDGTLYYLTGAPVYRNGKRVAGVDQIAKGAARGLEHLHLVTYCIPNGQYKDHGPVLYADGGIPTYVNSIALGPDRHLYTLARFEHQGKTIQDLIRFPNPLANGASEK